jgi:Prokaryotic dksA/traR C4-type zinc finger
MVAAGVIPASALAFERPSEFPAHIRPRSVGTMRLSKSSLSDPNQNDELGYLVLQTPVITTGQVPESEDSDSIWVTVSVPQATAALEPGVFGAACCGRCNRPIARLRLLAVPHTKICTNCQQKKETKC